MLSSGDFLVISSSVSLVLALTWGGVRYDWNSSRIVTLLTLGSLGLVGWIIYEWRVAAQPMVRIQTSDLGSTLIEKRFRVTF
jgi:hypothetical protein